MTPTAAFNRARRYLRVRPRLAEALAISAGSALLGALYAYLFYT